MLTEEHENANLSKLKTFPNNHSVNVLEINSGHNRNNLHLGLNRSYLNLYILVYDDASNYSYSSAEWLKADEERWNQGVIFLVAGFQLSWICCESHDFT